MKKEWFEEFFITAQDTISLMEGIIVQGQVKYLLRGILLKIWDCKVAFGLVG